MSRTVAVILDDDRWIWAYDVSLAILAVDVIDVAKTTTPSGEPWLDDLLEEFRMSIILQGTLGLLIPPDLTDKQRERLLALIAEASRRLRSRRSVTAAEAAERYAVNDHPVFLRGASSIDTTTVAELADAIANLVRGDLPQPPSGTQAWLYGLDGGPQAL